MAEKHYNLLKAASWYTLGNILIRGVSFLTLPIFTHLMSTHEYGIYSVYTSYLSIIQVVVLMGLSASIAVAYHAKEVEFESYVSTILLIPLGLAAGCMGIVNLWIPNFGNLLSMNVVFWNCLFVSAGAEAVSGILGARLVFEGRYKLYMAYSALRTVGNAALSLLLCYTLFRDHDMYFALVYGSTIAIVVGMTFLLLATKTKLIFQRNNLKYGFLWGVPLLFHTVATVVLTQSDRILIRYMDSYSSAGIYAIATTFASIPLMLQQSLNQAWIPWFYGKLNDREYDQSRWLNNRYIAMYGAIIAAYILISPEVIHLLTAESYWAAVYSLAPLLIGIWGEALYSMVGNIEYYYQKTKYIMLGTMITAGFNILLDILFINFYGYVGAAYATALSKFFLVFMHRYYARKCDSNEVFCNSIVSGVFLALCLGYFIVVMTLEYVLFRYILLSGILLFLGRYIVKNKMKIVLGLKEGVTK